MKPEAKKLVAEALLEAAKAVTTSLTDLSEDDWLVVYHGTSLSEVPNLINGFDATRLKYRLYGGPKHRGLFVTPDFKTAERFAPYGEVVLELLVRAKNLHGTDYSGRIGRQQKQEQKTEEWLAGKFPNSFRPYLSLTMTQAVEPQALLIGLVSPKQILRVWYKPTRSDVGRWYTRSEFLALGLEAGPSAEESQPKKVEDLGIDLSSPRLSLDEFLDAAARLAGIPRSHVESSLSMRAGKGEDEIVRLVERLGFQPKAAQAFARKFMKSLTNKQVAKALLAAASKLEAETLKTSDFGMKVVSSSYYPLFSDRGNYGQDLPVDVVVYTTQDKVSSELVQSYVDKIRAGERPAIELGEQITKSGATRLWVFDGHHRLVAYRTEGLPAPTYRYKPGMNIGGPWDAPRYVRKRSGRKP